MRCSVTLLGLVLAAAAAPAADPPKGKPNRLADEASPYLRQHARNPIDWYPWGPEALAKAKREGKLIFLSVGYSACHWCHVMERESFNDPGIAAVLNKHFVCIKVDREERPDVDEVYMTSMQLIGEASGWPLTVFLTPDGKPIFGGSYFPPDDKEVAGGKLQGLNTVLKKVIGLNTDKPKELLDQADKVAKLTADALDRNARIASLVPLDKEMVEEAEASFSIDPEHGGLGSRARGFRGPKFPQAPVLTFLHRRSAKSEALRKELALTLDKMAAGGIYDHLGGGFHRYATERTWTVPHFEKMLTDQAQLVELYAEAYRTDPKPAYKRVVAETLGFVEREMRGSEGGFATALDADTGHKEGAYYVWTREDLDALLTGPEARLFRQTYGLDEPNFEEKLFVLRLPKPADEQVLAKLAPLREKLLAAREKREKPFLDPKVLTGWNGLMIGAYAKAGAVLKEPQYLRRAEGAAGFVLARLRGPDGRLMRMYAARPGDRPRAHGTAFLEDYALLLHGLLNLHDATGDARWLDEAKKLAGEMTQWHGDADRGGFYTTAHDQEKLFVRGKDYQDGALPSGNGAAARGMARLGAATKDKKYRDEAEKTVQAFAPALRSSPGAVPVMAETLDRLLDGTR